MNYFRPSTESIKDKKVLFILRKFANEEMQHEWLWEHLFIAPFEFSNAGNGDVFFHDVAFWDIGSERMNKELYAISQRGKYDAVIHYWQPDWYNWHLNPSFDTLLRIRTELNIPLATIWCDTWCTMYRKQFEYMLPLYDVAIVTDSAKHVAHVKDFKDKVLNLLPPPNPHHFFDEDLERTIDLSFCGNKNIGWRSAYLDVLKNQNINCLESTGNNSFEAFANILKRSKISISFSHTQSGKKTLKGRVLEVPLCGALLLDEQNEETERYLTAYEHYVPFEDEEDLVEKARYYLTHSEECIHIAQKGKTRAQELARPEYFWGAIMERVDKVKKTDTGSIAQTVDAMPEIFKALHPPAESFEDAAPDLTGKRVCIWGTGGLYKKKFSQWLKLEKNNIIFIGFIDSAAEKWGTTLDGYPILAPDTIQKRNVEVILFATWAGKGIINQLCTEEKKIAYYYYY